MSHSGTVSAILTGALICGLSVGCGGSGATNYGWFSYKPPEGWARRVPPKGITLPPTVVQFFPDIENLRDAPRLEILDVTDQKSRSERVAALYAYAREREWRHFCAQAKRRGTPQPAFECKSIASALNGAGQVEGLSIMMEIGGKQRLQLLHFVRLPDGRRFRVEYVGIDPGFTEHRAAITASLKTLTFATVAPGRPELSRETIVASLQERLEGDRLWLYDGRVAGQRLSDKHLEALKDPIFADITDLNLISGHSATITGVDVTDEGLMQIKHLPLSHLCLRGSLVTDAGLIHLKGLPLKSLVVAETLVQGEGLRHLSGLPLKVLDLGGTRIGDDSLKHLAGLRLISLNLRDTRVTDAGLELLKEQLPDARISR